MSSASFIACNVCSVSNPGSPGPAPASQTSPGKKSGKSGKFSASSAASITDIAPEPALIGGVVERAFAKVVRGQHVADQDQRGSIDAGLANLGYDGAERGADNLLVRPAGAKHHDSRTILAIGRQQLGDGLVNGMNRQMDGERGPGCGKRGEVFARGHRRRAP